MNSDTMKKPIVHKSRNSNNLSEGSKSYHAGAPIYERFSQAEDAPGLILGYARKLSKDKVILDVGCGTGKYIPVLAPESGKYIGLDVSLQQIHIAKTKVGHQKNVRFLCSSAEKIRLADESVDLIFSSWALSTILDEERRHTVLQELLRVLKKNGKVYLVENDLGGEFETIRDRYPDITRTKAYLDWLKLNGFRPRKRFKSYFNFHSRAEARRIFGAIWGNRVVQKIKSKRIRHNIVIYWYKKHQ
jgi:ubiquinone/menaquinone biosynthesis C-methylase UbiE